MPLHLSPDPTVAARARDIISYPSFFSILLLEGWSNTLRIPSAFARLFLPQPGSRPSALCLQTSLSFWTVQYHLSTSDECTLTRGWEEFVAANSLEAGDVLIFFLTGDMHLSVTSYDPSVCAKILPLQADNLSFVPARFIQQRLVLKPYNKYIIQLHKEFREQSGIALLDEVGIYNRRGDCWPVEVRENRLSSGWNDFGVENSLAIGDQCILWCFLDSDNPLGRFTFFKAARVFESQLAILEGDRQLDFKKLATATLETLMPRVEEKGEFEQARWRDLRTSFRSSLLSIDPSVDPYKSLANISFGTEVEVQLGKRLQASVVRQMKDSEMTIQWTLNSKLTSGLRVLLQSAPSKRLIF